MPDKKIIPVVIGGLLKDGKILLIKRANEPYKGFWSLPGGKVNHGEHLEKAILREIEEETGIKAVFHGIEAVVSEHLKSEGSLDVHCILFICSLSAQDYSSRESEEGSLGWFELEKINSQINLILPTDYEIISQIILGKKGFHFNSSVDKTGEKYRTELFEKV